jgi:hypothetical protein
MLVENCLRSTKDLQSNHTFGNPRKKARKVKGCSLVALSSSAGFERVIEFTKLQRKSGHKWEKGSDEMLLINPENIW